MFEHCEVEATFTLDGMPKPHVIIWSGQRLVVTDYGRIWRTDDGLFMLVRVQDGRGFQLWYNGALWQARLENNKPTNFV